MRGAQGWHQLSKRELKGSPGAAPVGVMHCLGDSCRCLQLEKLGEASVSCSLLEEGTFIKQHGSHDCSLFFCKTGTFFLPTLLMKHKSHLCASCPNTFFKCITHKVRSVLYCQYFKQHALVLQVRRLQWLGPTGYLANVWLSSPPLINRLGLRMSRTQAAVMAPEDAGTGLGCCIGVYMECYWFSLWVCTADQNKAQIDAPEASKGYHL